MEGARGEGDWDRRREMGRSREEARAGVGARGCGANPAVGARRGDGTGTGAARGRHGTALGLGSAWSWMMGRAAAVVRMIPSRRRVWMWSETLGGMFTRGVVGQDARAACVVSRRRRGATSGRMSKSAAEEGAGMGTTRMEVPR